jgi:methionyl aminopeptidase
MNIPQTVAQFLWRHEFVDHCRRHARYHAADGIASAHAPLRWVFEERPAQGPILVRRFWAGASSRGWQNDHFEDGARFGGDASSLRSGQHGAWKKWGFIQPGVTTREVDDFAAARMRNYGAKSAFLGYRKFRARFAFRSTRKWCMAWAGRAGWSLAILSAWTSASRITVISAIRPRRWRWGMRRRAQRLMDVTEQALYEGIAQALPGNRVVDISRAVQKYVESNGFSIVREFVGHGVGRTVHEEPQVPNFVENDKQSPKLRPGMTWPSSRWSTPGTAQVVVLNDGWTVVTKDGQLSAHFEHTVLITEGEPEILTWPAKTPLKLKADSGNPGRNFVSRRIGQRPPVAGPCFGQAAAGL